MTEEVSQIPLGLCQCGCGEKTSISQYNVKSTGYVKGQPRRFVRGHQSRDPRIGRGQLWTVEDRGYITPCHIHIGGNLGGYGAMWRDGQNHGAHRLAWIDAFGPIPKDMNVLHRCDVMRCRNLDHLFLGTSSDNSADMVQKQRHCHGERHPLAKLTNDEVIKIRASKETVSVLARQYNVSESLIYKIRVNKAWKITKPKV